MSSYRGALAQMARGGYWSVNRSIGWGTPLHFCPFWFCILSAAQCPAHSALKKKEQWSVHSLTWTQPSTVRWPCCNRRRCHVIANCSAAALANIHTYVQLTEIRRPISWRLKARTGSPPWSHCIQSARSVSRQVPEKETQKQSLAIPDFCQHLIMGMFMLSNGHFVLSGLISICVWKWHIAAGNSSGKVRSWPTPEGSYQHVYTLLRLQKSFRAYM